MFDGTVRIDGETIDLAGWPGMVGHNWGEQHADSWIWLHGLGFEGRGADTWLDVAVGRIALGPVTTPWVANGALSLDGERTPVGGLGRRVTVVAEDDHCVLRLPGKHVTVIATAAAPARRSSSGTTPTPTARRTALVNCSIADTRVHVERPDAEPMTLSGPHRGRVRAGPALTHAFAGSSGRAVRRCRRAWYAGAARPWCAAGRSGSR